jgi:hypothetical protein
MGLALKAGYWFANAGIDHLASFRSPSPKTAFPDLIWLLKASQLRYFVKHRFLMFLYEAKQINKDNIIVC